MYRPGFRRRSASILAIALMMASVLASDLNRASDKARIERLSRVHVFYSDPPFEYEPAGKIRIRVVTLWDRDRMEGEIRRQVARKGADLVILEDSFVRFDQPPRVIYEPTPRGHGRALVVPMKNAYVEGRIGTRIKDTEDVEWEHLYPFGFDAAWNAVIRTVSALGWSAERVDLDSRYLVTFPVASTAVTMRCDPPRSAWLPAVFTVFVNTHAGNSLIRLDVGFVERSGANRAPCRSSGVYEQAFFRQLEKKLAEDSLDE